MRFISFIIIIVFAGITNMQAQDLDIYKHHKNSNFELPNIPKEMTFEEFKLLSTDIRMQDMMMAMVLPGHIHFKIGEKKTAFYVLGARAAGFAGWTYLSLSDESLTNIVFYDSLGVHTNVSTGNIIVAYGSLVLIIGSYLYDWIHGKYLLDRKQNKIRYKYAKQKVQVGFSNIKINQLNYPGLALTFNF